ncbi:uncharacterized protein [Pyrus communis]|uniref:uncharacterized protein n=1 Tax=Pyrus communis TaxID=23211 RepID=UPI0035C0424E
MSNCSGGDVLIAKGDKLSLAQCPVTDFEMEDMKNKPSASLVSSVIYPQVCTRPDLAFALSYLVGFNRILVWYSGMQINCGVYLKLWRGLAFRGHDESEDSSNKGNFLELLKFLADHNEGIKDVVFKNAPENLKLTSPEIQKYLVYAATCETTNAIMFDIGDDAFFSVLVDESRDISVKEHMAVVLRYVNTNEQVVERFVGTKHVPNTTAFSLKEHHVNVKTWLEKDNKPKLWKLFKIMSFQVLEMIIDDGVSLDQRGEADILLNLLQSFDFVSSLFLMKEILGITNVLSHALQKKDLDIVSAMALVKACKQQLQAMRDNGWDACLDKVSSFCGKHDIDIPDMNDIFVAQGRSWHRVENLTNLHHYHVDLFIDVIDKQLQELNSRFNETST